jgi:hypothetical protein
MKICNNNSKIAGIAAIFRVFFYIEAIPWRPPKWLGKKRH